MCKYLNCNCSKICVNYGGIVDIGTGMVIFCLKDFIIPSFYSQIHNYVLLAVGCFLTLKGIFLLFVLRLRKKLQLLVLIYLVVTTIFLLWAKLYIIYCAIQKFNEVEQNYPQSLKLHHNYILIVTFALVCPTVLMLMWHIQLYLYLFYRTLARN